MAKGKERKEEEPKKAVELKKHVAMIHSSNRLSLLQRKIANALLFNAYKDLMNKDEYEIHVATLCKLIGYDSNDYKTIKKSLVNLLSTVLEWNLVDGDKLDSEGVWNASSIIADASIDGPICTYSYSNKMRKLLHRPTIYGRLDMMVQAKFQSSYGLALYENCNRYQDIGQSPWFDIEKFRKLMGVEEGKYKIFRDFKTRVLDKAVEEVNMYSPITLAPQLRRVKQKVVAIQFLIKKRNTVARIKAGVEQPELMDVLKLQYGFSKRQITDTLAQYADKYIREKISLIESSSSFQTGKIKNLAKYLMKALAEDYQAPKSGMEEVSVVNKSSAKKQKSASNVVDFSDPDLKRDRELGEQYNHYVRKELMAIVECLTPIQLEALTKEFEKYLSKSVRGIYKDIYARDGIENPLIQDHLITFIRRDKQDIVEKVATYTEWLDQVQESIAV
jgi:plasmid replication initiation protein